MKITGEFRTAPTGSQGEFLITLTSLSDFQNAALTTSITGGLLEASELTDHLNLIPGAITIPIQLRMQGSGWDEFHVALGGPNGSLSAQVFFFGRLVGGPIRQVTPRERSESLAAEHQGRIGPQAEAKANALALAAVARGLHPVPSYQILTESVAPLPGQPLPNSESQKAWDRVASRYATHSLIKPLTGPCGPNILTTNNHSFDVGGQFKYWNEDGVGYWTYPSSGGFPVTVGTEVEVRNECEDVAYITRAYTGTRARGHFQHRGAKHCGSCAVKSNS